MGAKPPRHGVHARALVRPAFDGRGRVVDGDVEASRSGAWSPPGCAARCRASGRLEPSVVQRRTTGVGSGVPEALTARTAPRARPVERPDQPGAAAAVEPLARVDAAFERSRSSHPVTSSTRSERVGGGGAPVTVVFGADRSVVQRHGSATPVLPPASTARASKTCAPSPTVTDAGHAPQAPPSSRHSRRAATSSTSTREGGRSVATARAGPSASVTRGAASIVQSHTAGERRRGCRRGRGPRSGGCRR